MNKQQVGYGLDSLLHNRQVLIYNNDDTSNVDKEIEDQRKLLDDLMKK